MRSIELQNSGYTLRGIHHEVANHHAMVVMLHGFTGNKNENGYLFKDLSFFLEEHGYSSLRFDYYGNGDSDGAFEQMTIDTVISDIVCIVSYAKKLTTNIVLLGFSMGGLAASLLSKELLNELNSLVLISPAFNFVDICKRYSNIPRYLNKYIDLGGFLLNEDFIDSITSKDLMKNLPNIKVRTLIIQGENDQVALKEYALLAHQNINSSQLHLISDAPHCYTKMSYREQLKTIILNFLKEKKV